MVAMAKQGRGRPTVICAWCSCLLSTGEGTVSHGICRECEQRVMALAEEHFRETPKKFSTEVQYAG